MIDGPAKAVLPGAHSTPLTDREDSSRTNNNGKRGDMHSQGTRLWKSFSYASVGIEMAVATLIGWGFGFWLDRKLGTYPVLMLIFLLLGVTAGFRGLFRAARQAKRDAAESQE